MHSCFGEIQYVLRMELSCFAQVYVCLSDVWSHILHRDGVDIHGWSDYAEKDEA